MARFFLARTEGDPSMAARTSGSEAVRASGESSSLPPAWVMTVRLGSRSGFGEGWA